MKVCEALERARQLLAWAGYGQVRLESEVLLSRTLNLRREDLIIRDQSKLSDEQASQFFNWVERRATGEPIAYIIGVREFFGFDFHVGPGVLIPRPDTEVLVEAAMAFVKASKASACADLGSGSGCILLSLLKLNPGLRGWAIERSSQALAYLKSNIETLGVGEQAVVINGDALDWQPAQQLDFVVANPPYISRSDERVEFNVKKFEPNEALFADDDGLADIKSWSQAAKGWLRPGGKIFFEIGIDQARQTREALQKIGYHSIEQHLDLQGIARVISATK